MGEYHNENNDIQNDTLTTAFIYFDCKKIFRSGFLNPTDSLVATELMFLATALFPSMWTTPIHKLIPLLPSSLGNKWVDYALNIHLGELIVIGSLYTAFTAAYHMFRPFPAFSSSHTFPPSCCTLTHYRRISCQAVLEYWKEEHDHKSVTPRVLRDFLKSRVVLLPSIS